MVRAIDRLIQLDEQETARQRERVAFLALTAAIIDSLPEGLVVTDAEGAIFLINEKTEFLFGYHRSQLIGKKVEFLLPERYREQHVKHRQRYVNYDTSPYNRAMGGGMQLAGLRSDGHEFPVQITLSRMVVPQGIYSLSLIRYAPGASAESSQSIPATDGSSSEDTNDAG